MSELIIGLSGHNQVVEIGTLRQQSTAMPSVVDEFSRVPIYFEFVVVRDKTPNVLVDSICEAFEAWVSAH